MQNLTFVHGHGPFASDADRAGLGAGLGLGGAAPEPGPCCGAKDRAKFAGGGVGRGRAARADRAGGKWGRRLGPAL